MWSSVSSEFSVSSADELLADELSASVGGGAPSMLGEDGTAYM